MSSIGATEDEQKRAYNPLPNNDGLAKIQSLFDE